MRGDKTNHLVHGLQCLFLKLEPNGWKFDNWCFHHAQFLPGVEVVEYYTGSQSADTAVILYSELLPKLDTL